MSTFLILSSSHRNSSVTTVSTLFEAELRQHVDSVTHLVLDEQNLPLCDGGPCYKNPAVIAFQQTVAAADGIAFSTPIYNYDVNAAAKNVLELCGHALKYKTIALLVKAGGEKSYLSPLGFINSLMMDCRCIVVPRYLYLTSADFNADRTQLTHEPHRRLSSLASTWVSLTARCKGYTHD